MRIILCKQNYVKCIYGFTCILLDPGQLLFFVVNIPHRILIPQDKKHNSFDQIWIDLMHVSETSKEYTTWVFCQHDFLVASIYFLKNLPAELKDPCYCCIDFL